MKPANRSIRNNLLIATAVMAFAMSAMGQGGEDFEPVDLPDNIAGKVAAPDQEKIDFLCGAGIAMRKKGITDPQYLSPLTTGHGHDN